MAAARDQAARILRPEPDAAEGFARRFRRCRRPASFPCLGRARCPPLRRSAGQPWRRQTGRRAGRRRRSRRAEIRQAQTGPDGRGRAARARRGQLCRSLRSGRALLHLHRRRLCARQQHHARRPGVRPHRGDPARRQRRGPHRRRDLPDRRRRLSHRGGCGAQQDRDPAGHHRPHRPPGRRDGKRGRAVQGATRFLGSFAEAGRSRFRAPAGAEHPGICLARHVRSLGSRPRPGRRLGEVGASRL